MEDEIRELSEKLKEMYPQIMEYNLTLQLEFNPQKAYWVVKLERDDFKLHSYLAKKDANACLEGRHCVYLGVQIGQFINNFKFVQKKE